MLTLHLHLSNFGWEAARGYTERYGTRPEALFRLAITHYLAEADTGRAAHAFPRLVKPDRFRRTQPRDPGQVYVDLPDELFDALRDQAQRQGVALEALAEHAVLFYLADIDAVKAELRSEDGLAGS